MGAGGEACAATSTLSSGKKLGAGAGGPGSSDFLSLMSVLQPLDLPVKGTNVAYIECRVSKRTAENTEQRTLVGVGAECPRSIDTTCPLDTRASSHSNSP